MPIGSATQAEVGKSDPIITRLANEDKKPFYKKPNLLYLYLMLFPTCMGIELTSGFDSQMINALQIVPYWKLCKQPRPLPQYLNLLSRSPAPKKALTPLSPDFGDPKGPLKGIIAAAYSLGAILSLPLIPIVNDRFGRRWSIFGGSVIMVIGALIQGFSVHGEPKYADAECHLPRADVLSHSRHVHHCPHDPRLRNPNLYRLRFLTHRRACLS
jgi:hypothetical protein